MADSKLTMLRKLQAVVALATGLAMGMASTPAFAAPVSSTPATPSQVEYNGTILQLYIFIGGVMYVGQLPVSGCGGSTHTVDTLKTWTSIAQAALLSGKKLLVWYDTGGSCGTGKYINSLALQS
jgi:hypothetical protein